MSVELFVGDPVIDPVDFYSDLVDLPDPVKQSFSVRIFNYDAVPLYMQVVLSGVSPWTNFTTSNLGSVGSGANIWRNLDRCAERAKPASPEDNVLTLTLKAYTDAGYSNLKWQVSKNVTVHFIKSDDGSWTTDVSNDFDDGTVQGWSGAAEANQEGGYPTVAVATDYVLSPSYSLKMTESALAGPSYQRARIKKSITTPAARPTCLAIVNIRCSSGSGTIYTQAAEVRFATALLIHLGRELGVGIAGSDTIPRNRWLRIVVPLKPNTTGDMEVALETGNAYATDKGYLWMDNFKVISK